MESRRLLSVNVTNFHDDIASDGVNANETQLTPANVKLGSFGKLYTTSLDGEDYTQPLIVTGVTITAGPNTTVGETGVHDVAIVGTENDSLYAIDAGVTGGAVLWKRSFLNLAANQIGTTTGSNVNNTLNATSIVPVPSSDVGINDIYPVMGITGTPVIDTTNGIIYVVTFARETINSTTHYVQMLHAVDITNGTDKVLPFLIGDTPNSNNNINNTPIYTYGSGDGSVTDPYNNTGKSVVEFNALRENQRAALSLVNGTVYVSWASHGDNGPYHGWVVTWNVSNVLSTGMVLSGVLDTSPNGGESGIWMGGGALTFEPNGSAFYFETGNGPADGGGTQLNSAGFPTSYDFPDAVIRAVADPTTTATNQGHNGWGLKIVDYFIPYNQPELDNADEDFGSGQPLVLPASAGIAGHPDLLIAAGKQGTIYLLDRDNLGHYSINSDAALNSVPNGQGQNTPPVLISGALSAPSYYNSEIYWNTGYNGGTEQFSISPTGIITKTGTTPEASFGYLPGSVSISSDGANDGIVWSPDTNLNELHAYVAGTLSTELWNTSQKAGNADSTGVLNKFATPTVVNAQVYVGTASALVVYGLTPPQNSAPQTAVLTGTTLSSFAVNLSWTDSSVTPNLASGYSIQELINGTYQTVTTASAGATSIEVGGLAAQTAYFFRIIGFNGIGNSAPSNSISLTTTGTGTSLSLGTGFAGSSALITLNGSAAIKGSSAVLTDGGSNEAGSLFADTPFNISQFKTSFQFQFVGGSADGFTFTLQSNTLAALGSNGGSLGYGTFGSGGAYIGNSVAVKFDLYSNAGEGVNSTGIYENGANPTLPAIDLTPSGVNLHSGNIFNVAMAYDGTNLTVTITDTKTNATATQTYPINLTSYTGSQAYVGFTGGTGGQTTTTNILNWTFAPYAVQAPATPTGLGGAAASASSITLIWTNNSTTQTGFLLDRAADSLFTQSLLTQTIAGNVTTFTDTAAGLFPGGTYYYRIRATNNAGGSANSAYTSVSIPVAPDKPTDATVEDVSSSEVDLSWTDNAGRTADGYNVLRAVNQGAFTLYAQLPALNGSDEEGGPQSTTYEWSDTNVLPGTFYEYHIEAYNISGYNDFSGTGVTTLTAPPTLTAIPGNNIVNLSWSVPTGAVAYNVYSGSASGAETLLASNLSSPSYSDNTATNGTTSYYYVTALNINLPPLDQESDPSNEVSATPQVLVLNFNTGFAGSASTLTYNGSAVINGSNLQLTNGGSNEAASVFSSGAVDVTHFTDNFQFQFVGGSADGFTFTFQGIGPTALGSAGGGLGYGTDGGTGTVIGKSVAIKFDLYSNSTEGPDSTGIYENGANPILPSTDLTPSGVNLHSGDVFNVAMTYDGTTLTVTITDTQTKAAATEKYTVNIPSYTGSQAYVGFTGGTGGLTTTTNILNWAYTPTPQVAPAAPTSLNAVAQSASSVLLSWTDGSSNQTGFYLDRATNSSFTANLVTQTLPANNTSFTDTAAGLIAGGTYYYQIRAFNSIGPSGNSSPATSVTIPLPPAPPTGLSATATANNSTPQVVLNWNASIGATSYDVYRSTSTSTEAPPPIATNVSGTSFTDSPPSFGITYFYEVQAIGIGGSSTLSTEASAKANAPVIPIPAYNFSSGFAGSTSKLTYNGSATINGNNAQLTNGGSNEAASVFSTGAVDVTHFTNNFQFQFIGGSADGFTFTFQGIGPTALGSAGGGLGYGTDGGTGTVIGKSVAIKFDLYSNSGEGSDSTGIYENGANPILPSTDLTPTGVNLHSGDVFNVAMTYNGSTLAVTITDTQTNATATQNYTINIPSYTGSTAYVGFTGGTGGLTTTTNILNWVYTPTPQIAPAAPTSLSAVAQSAGSVLLSWADGSSNQTGFYLDRATNNTFTANLVTQTLPAGNTSFTDTATGLVAGGTYYYQIRAFNSIGPSGNSSPATSVTIPLPPAAPLGLNATATANSSSPSIVLNWNASIGAVSYVVYRSISTGTETSPAVATGITGTAFTDSPPSFGVTYYYEVQAVGIGGSSTFSTEAFAKATAPLIPIPAYNFSSGFTGSTSKLTYNGSAALNGTNAQLTSGLNNQTGSVFSNTAVDVTHFNTSFGFQFIGGSADGFTFTIQGNSSTALGSAGGGLGYGTDGGVGTVIGKSVAIKFDLFSNSGEGSDSTGIYENGASPTTGAVDLTPSGVNLHSGNVFNVSMSYNGTTLTVTITDTVTKASATQQYTVNIPSFTGSAAYVGFTGGTGGLTTTTNILNWIYTPGTT